MVITTKLTYKVTYSVVYFEGTEGGMDTGTFSGKEHESIKEALAEWEIAQATQTYNDWEIVCDITKAVTKVN